jgi:uncharacterized protein
MEMTYANLKLTETKVFKDPVHRYIHVQDQVIWDLIGTKEFQRLRRIKQLGTAYFTFHGAEHSRFTHSLGVYEIIRRMIDDVFASDKEWDANDRLLCLCAALLHDVGHGPFSHSFEKVFQLDHEQYTLQMIIGNTEINTILKKVAPTFPEQVAAIIGKTSHNDLAISMISSQIDADRMDYLLRDAYYTGVSYGKFDLERLLRVMRPNKLGIVLKNSGMHAVEHYIMSRYQMYWQVYFHPVSRSAEVQLGSIFRRVKQLSMEQYAFKYQPEHFTSLFDGNSTLEDYLRLDEMVVMYYFQGWQEEADVILADLCRRFLNRNLMKYVEFTEQLATHWNELVQLFREVGIDPEYYLIVNSISDLPYDFYVSSTSTRMPILLLMPDDSLRELSQESYIVAAISGKEQTERKLFYPYDLIYQYEGNNQAINKIKQILENK